MRNFLPSLSAQADNPSMVSIFSGSSAFAEDDDRERAEKCYKKIIESSNDGIIEIGDKKIIKNLKRKGLGVFKLFGIVILGFSIVACADMYKPDDPTTQPNQQAADYNAQLGFAYLRQGNMARSKQKFLLALKQAPNWAPAYDGMAYYLEQTGQIKAAEDYYQKAIGISDTGSSLNNYGTFLCRQKRYTEALSYFDRAVADTHYIRSGEALENAGLCALMIPNHSLAQSYFKKSLLRDPNRPNALIELASFSFKSKHYQQTASYLRRFNATNDPTAQSLWLGIRLARKQDNADMAASNALLLKQRFPKSKEYRQFLTTKA